MAHEFHLTDLQVTILSNLSLLPASAFYEDSKLVVTDEAEAAELESWLAGTDWSPQAVLDNTKARLRAAIDQQAEEERLRYITAGAGQAMTYAQKAEEARLCIAASDPDPDDYPLLAAEIGITASTLVGVAQVVATANAQWLQIGAAIEAARLSAKKSVAEAETVEDAQAAADAIVWP